MHAHQEIRSRAAANLADDLKGEPCTVVERSAPPVRAPVGQWREKTRDQEALGPVDVDPIESRPLAQFGCAAELGDTAPDLLVGDLGRSLDAAGGQLERDRRRREPTCLVVDIPGAGVTTGVDDLHDRQSSVRGDGRGEPGQPRQVFFAGDERLPGHLPACRADREVLGDDNPGAPACPSRVVLDLSIADLARLVAVAHRHRGEHHPVAGLPGADPQAGEQLAGGGGRGHRASPATRSKRDRELSTIETPLGSVAATPHRPVCVHIYEVPLHLNRWTRDAVSAAPGRHRRNRVCPVKKAASMEARNETAPTRSSGIPAA